MFTILTIKGGGGRVLRVLKIQLLASSSVGRLVTGRVPWTSLPWLQSSHLSFGRQYDMQFY